MGFYREGTDYWEGDCILKSKNSGKLLVTLFFCEALRLLMEKLWESLQYDNWVTFRRKRAFIGIFDEKSINLLRINDIINKRLSEIREWRWDRNNLDFTWLDVAVTMLTVSFMSHHIYGIPFRRHAFQPTLKCSLGRYLLSSWRLFSFYTHY